MSRKLTTKEFIERAKAVHGDEYGYSYCIYDGSHKPIIIECPIHGKFKQRSAHHISGTGCPKCATIYKSSNTVEFTKSALAIHGDIYDYSKVNYVNNSTKVCITCPTHGEFYQNPASHLKGHGCSDCRNYNISKTLTSTLNEFIDKATKTHNTKYDYSEVVYITSSTNVNIICPDHGTFTQTPNNHLQGKGCSKCVNHISADELKLNQYISQYVKSIQATRSIINPLELDIFIPSKNIAIEYNGNYWHSELNGKDKNYHLNKTKLCNDKGIKLIHIFEDEWNYKQQIVKNRIKSIIGMNKYKVYARKTIIKEIDNKTKSKFLNKYHIQGDDRSSIRLGCFYKNRLVAVMTFGKRRYDKKDGYELIRYCTIGNFTCIGCAGKLLKNFERNWNPTAIVSYADLRWSEGNVYKQLGFKRLHNSKPNYFYMRNHKKRESRLQYQKHKLKDKLDTFDPNISEWENMQANGYDRIWDCGNMVFEKVY